MVVMGYQPFVGVVVELEKECGSSDHEYAAGDMKSGSQRDPSSNIAT